MSEEHLGTRFRDNRYRLSSRVDRNSFGGGVAAFDPLEKRNVLILEVPADNDASSDNELRSLAAADRIDQLTDLDHAALIKVHDYFIEDGQTFLVIEPVDARSFADLFSRERTPALANILQWADDLFDALIYLHTRPDPFIHNDITPSNAWLTLSSNVKLAFPAPRTSAKADLASGPESRDLPYRSLEYLWEDIDPSTKLVISRGFDDAPVDELIRSKPDERADIYSLSATLYFAMTKIPPADAMTRTVEVLDGRPDPIKAVCEINHNISESISNVIMRGLTVKRAERYHSAYEMRMDLASATAPYFDSLTRLPNDQQFRTHLQSAIEEATEGNRPKFSLMLLELEDMNAVFDRAGRLLGNEAIHKISERIKQSVRVNDVVGRIAPSTFALLLYESGAPSDVVRIAGRIQSRIAEPLNLEGTAVEMVSSAGSSISGTPDKTVEAYLEEARSAVESAREIGPNSSAIY